MKEKQRFTQQHVVIVLFALILASSTASFTSYRATSRYVSADMQRALTIALHEQQTPAITQDTIRTFNRHLQIAALRGKATLAVDTRSHHFKAYPHCSEATIFALSDQRPAIVLWILTCLYALWAWRRPKKSAGCTFGGLTYLEPERRFVAVDGRIVNLTPMQQQLMEMFFNSPTHTLMKTEICDTLWPKKPDATATLYTLIRRLKPIIENHSSLQIESDRSKAYRLTIKDT